MFECITVRDYCARYPKRKSNAMFWLPVDVVTKYHGNHAFNNTAVDVS